MAACTGMESNKSPIYNKVCVSGRFCNVSESLSYLVDQRYSGKKSKRPATKCHMPVFGDKRHKPYQPRRPYADFEK